MVLTLKDLPDPPQNKTGWPWTEQTQPLPVRMPSGSEWTQISIVTPSYNQDQFIEETIRSVLLQGYPNLEYIVIDGCSGDNTIEILKKYEKYLNYWVSESDQGPADAINKGWERANGEIFAYLNSDDAYLPGALAVIASAFKKNTEAQVICGNELKIDREGFLIGESKIKNVDRLSLLNLNFIPQPAIFIKGSLLRSVKGLNLKIQYVFDFELWLRFTRFASIMSIPDLLAVTRWHDTTITTTCRPEIGSELVHVIETEIKTYPPDLEQHEIQKIIFNVNYLAMNLYLESGKFIGAIRYVLASISLSQGIFPRFFVIKKYASVLLHMYRIRLSRQINFFLGKQGIPCKIGSNKHWSSLTNLERTLR